MTILCFDPLNLKMKQILIILTSCFLLFVDGYSLSGSKIISKPSGDSSATSCSEPITWKIGAIDSRFDIGPSDLKTIMKDVENLWSNAVNQNLIQYSDSGDISINFIYSDKQKFTDNEKELSEQINSMRGKHYIMRMDYQEESLKFQEKLNRYNQTYNEYATKVNEYNLRLSRLTTDGVIPREDDEKLKNLKKEMEFLQKKLSPLEEELTLEEKKLNRLSEKLNDYADEVNEYVFQYRNQFSNSRTFYQGFYTDLGNQKKINIYQFENLDKLRLVLAHEFGHALGLSHTQNPVSIMNYNMQLQNDSRLKLSDQDILAIQTKCGPSQASM